jgi:hypothetical protein
MGETEACVGRTPPAVALRYQHMMAGRDQAIAAALDELVQAAANLPPQRPTEGLVARTRRAKPAVQTAALLVDADLGCSG